MLGAPLEPRDSSTPRSQLFPKSGSEPTPATINDDTIQMDHNAVVLFTIDRLARSPLTTVRRRSTRVLSGPNYLVFSDADRPSDSLRDRSGVEWSPRRHAPVLGAPQRALDRNFWQIMVQSNRAQRTLLICMHRWKPPRVRCRRLRTSSSDQKRSLGDHRAANRQDPFDAAVMSGPSISRIKKIIFFGPQ